VAGAEGPAVLEQGVAGSLLGGPAPSR
jgi:hypothetical protein